MNCSFVVFAAVGQTAKKLSLEEIGAMEGITREGVRQIEKRAIKKIRLAIFPADAAEPEPALPVLEAAAMPPGW
jgi:hypothetical protein